MKSHFYIRLEFNNRYAKKVNKMEDTDNFSSDYKKMIRKIKKISIRTGYFEDFIDFGSGFSIEFVDVGDKKLSSFQLKTISRAMDEMLLDKEIRKHIKSAKLAVWHQKFADDIYKSYKDNMSLWKIRYATMTFTKKLKPVGDGTDWELAYATNKKSALQNWANLNGVWTNNSIEDDFIIDIKEIKSDGGIIGFLNQKF